MLVDARPSSAAAPAEARGGRHVIIECFGEQAGYDAVALERLLRRAAAAGRATVLSCHMHGFGASGGVTGVALLAESHITVHTWPEAGYAAFDVFMCGSCDADRAAAVLAEAAPAARAVIRRVARPSPAADSGEGASALSGANPS